ncbi:hypothetical protein WMW72_24575 [Paenibacillus filicis]|uniref:Methyltransferase type 11 domain-containing protein n=1 Tax=Paenibacillus filicis TaxID=669464 RepID=A0ABU9DTM0_9BACL
MVYQPLDWNSDWLILLKTGRISSTELFTRLELNEVERFTFDRAISISNYLKSKWTPKDRYAALDLGASGGVFSLVLNTMLDMHCTAVDDDRYILIQDENSLSSITQMNSRFKNIHINNVLSINSSIEDFIEKLPNVPLYDVVLLLNILHHFFTGYGQGTEHGKLEWDEFKSLVVKLGVITGKYLFFETNSLVFPNYEKYLTDLLYLGNFDKLELVTRSYATDGSLRAVWCFIK